MGHVELAAIFLEAGIGLFQVREKRLPDLLLYQQLVQVRQLCTKFEEVRFLVNDRVDLALAVGADGVHLGQDDLPVQVARELLGEKAIIGLSTHNQRQFEEGCRLPVDYLAIGPVFPTGTKESDNQPLGVEMIGRLASETDLPIVAIGGITLQTAPELWKAGVASVAVISDITNAPDPGMRMRQYLEEGKKLLADS